MKKVCLNLSVNKTPFLLEIKDECETIEKKMMSETFYRNVFCARGNFVSYKITPLNPLDTTTPKSIEKRFNLLNCCNLVLDNIVFGEVEPQAEQEFTLLDENYGIEIKSAILNFSN